MDTLFKPELVFGLVGPIGVDMGMIQSKLEHALISVGYVPVPIRLTSLMEQISVDEEITNDNDPVAYYESRIRYANAVRAKCENGAALAALGILEIRSFRDEMNREKRGEPKMMSREVV